MTAKPSRVIHIRNLPEGATAADVSDVLLLESVNERVGECVSDCVRACALLSPLHHPDVVFGLLLRCTAAGGFFLLLFFVGR